MANQKIIPHLWFDKEAIAAAEFYTEVFGSNSKINKISKIRNTPSGDCDVVSFTLLGHEFASISAGPLFKLNSSISFIVGCEKIEEIDNLWNHVSQNGKVLMPYDKYPWSEKYGWVQDKYGVSWQLILTKPEGEERPKIVPSLLFTGEVYEKAEEAVKFYLSIFKNSKLGSVIHYGPDQDPNKEGTLMFSDFKLENTWFSAMDGGDDHGFEFNEAISFIVNCKDQSEINYYWDKLTANGGQESMCGWLKDKYGVSWQIVPQNMNELMSKNAEKTTPIMLKMKKLIIKELEEAGE